MLQVNFIKNNREQVVERLAVKNFNNIELLDKVIALDNERKALQFEQDELQSRLNIASKEIGMLMGKGEKEKAEQKKLEVSELKSLIEPLKSKLEIAEKNLQANIVLLPNLPHTSVPKGKAAEDNEKIKEVGEKPQLYKGAVPHWDLAKKYEAY